MNLNIVIFIFVNYHPNFHKFKSAIIFALHATLIVQQEHELVYIIIVHFYFQQVNYNLVS